MKVYTKTGDRGVTSLFSGQRVPKDHARVEVYGTLDEASAALGLAKSLTKNEKALSIIHRIQAELFDVNADLATELGEEAKRPLRYRLTEDHARALEQSIDSLEAARIPQKGFVIPGASSAGAAIDLARTIVRRAERAAVKLSKFAEVHPPVMVYLNRLSDLLFVLARFVDQEEMIAQVTAKVKRILTENSAAGLSPEERSFFEQPILEPATEQPSTPEHPAANDAAADTATSTKKPAASTLLGRAKAMIEAAEAKAAEIGVPMVITVVDGGGNLVAQHRMDGALLASIAISRDKAYTAMALKMSTEAAAALAQPYRALYGLNTVDGGRLVVFGGGIPIADDGVIIGAIGVSGGSVEQDIAVAQAGLDA
ncbi:cob(I)yrinic acid a,c-diamide adenosyltransferase [Heliomicrobium gestii]|nr:cob(I)yrinic acid a,c-diamide adenosyltransferase [Heliomicrobium gestii]MBM7866984.1 ATP:cob(I)alamin adenosyltransferase [Heliomicrobium gestii]